MQRVGSTPATSRGWMARATSGVPGRAKDIIIRGGENIPVVEIEALLHGHAAVQMAAIVAMPDPRLGERACAFVLPRPGQTLTFDEMRRFLEAQRVAPAYLPERLVLLDAMPMTAAGKVQKFVLREQARALATEGGDHPATKKQGE